MALLCVANMLTKSGFAFGRDLASKASFLDNSMKVTACNNVTVSLAIVSLIINHV